MKKIVLCILLLISLLSCKDLFEYSPYQVSVDNADKAQNSKNLIRIEANNKNEFKSFRIVLFGDTHTYYDDFTDIVNELNKRDDYDFIINMGDITLSGINKEFNWYSKIISRLKKPIITIIGNHDCLSNGQKVFEDMFGPTSFTFVYNDCKFVLFDDIIWEKDMKDPDFDWFKANLVNPIKEDGSNTYKHVIPLAHIQPWDDQFSYGNELAYNYYLNLNKIKYSFHGHTHNYILTQPYPNVLGGENVVKYVTTEAADDRGYLILTIEENDIKIEKVNF